MDDRTLSTSESVIMKAIWDNSGESDLSIPELIDILRERYDRDYARTTVVTFLLKLSDKRFVRTYRKGKLSYVHPTKSIDSYRMRLLQDTYEFWYNGNAELMDAEYKQINKH